MRIVGGRFGGRSLKGPSSDKIRPTSDRLRETLFNILTHRCGSFDGLRVIDLFAGTGALGLEALSRGARFALLVDEGSEARALLRANVEALGLSGATRIFRRDARKLGIAPPGDPFDIAFLDPPYGQKLAEPVLIALRDGGWLRPDAMVIVEESSDVTLDRPSGYVEDEVRDFSGTRLHFLRTDARPVDR